MLIIILGILAVGVGKIEEALPFFKTALESNAKVEQFWLSYINALIKLDRLHDARQGLQQGQGLGLKGDKVDQLATQLTDEVPGPVRATHPNKEQMDGVIALYTQGKFEEALVQGNILAGQFPNSHMVPNILGAIYSRLEKHEEAVAHYSRAIKLKPDFAEAYNNLAASQKLIYRTASFSFPSSAV